MASINSIISTTQQQRPYLDQLFESCSFQNGTFKITPFEIFPKNNPCYFADQFWIQEKGLITRARADRAYALIFREIGHRKQVIFTICARLSQGYCRYHRTLFEMEIATVIEQVIADYIRDTSPGNYQSPKPGKHWSFRLKWLMRESRENGVEIVSKENESVIIDENESKQNGSVFIENENETEDEIDEKSDIAGDSEMEDNLDNAGSVLIENENEMDDNSDNDGDIKMEIAELTYVPYKRH